MAPPLLELASALVRTPSISPDGGSGCQELLIDALKPLGFTIHRLPFGRVDNFYARLGSRGKNFCFAGHSDVVGPGETGQWRSDPFAAEVRDGILTGRGACDMKGGLAAMVGAARGFLARHPGFADHDSLSFLITGDEEGDAEDGTVRVLEWLAERSEGLDYCLVGEPTSAERLGDCLKNGRRGSLNGELTIRGRQGHVAYPHRADNPIHRAAPLLAQLAAIAFDSGDDHFPATAMQFTNIRAGDGATNVIPGRLQAGFNIRFSPASSPDSLEAAIRGCLDRGGLSGYELTMKLSGLPFITPGGPLLEAVRGGIRQTLEIEPELSTGGGTSDARFIARVCPQTIEFGPVGRTMHQIDEQLPVADLEALAKVYQQALEQLFFPPAPDQPP